MSRALRLSLWAAAVVAVAGWTLLVLAAGWLLQALGGALAAMSPAAALQTLDAWLQRPWAMHWLGPGDAAALRDGADWLLGLGGGPAAWAGPVTGFLVTALAVAWAGGLVLAAAAAWVARAAWRALREGWRQVPAWPRRMGTGPADPVPPMGPAHGTRADMTASAVS